MKKTLCILIAVLLSLTFPISVAAKELTSCAITGDSVTGSPSETVTVPVRVGDNSGFTNFAIALDYDREHLTLKSIDTGSSLVEHGSVNIQWEDDAEKTFGYVVAACEAPVKENGILFTATFEIAGDFIGEAEVTPKVQYIRNNEAVFSVFEEINAAITAGRVISVLTGDVSGDIVVEYNDVMLAYKAFLGEIELTPEQLAVVDTNRNGTVEASEYEAIYQIYIGG